MLIARRRRERLLWTIGAALMGVVVLKLFVADLSNLSGMMRIVAFLGVGVLMLLMGYFVPMPPKFIGKFSDSDIIYRRFAQEKRRISSKLILRFPF